MAGRSAGASEAAPAMTPEVEQLRAALDGLRAGVLKNVAGLVQHLTFVESMWFEEVVAGRKPTRGNRSMQVDQSVPLRSLVAEYRAACATSNEIIEEVGDADAPLARNGKTR